MFHKNFSWMVSIEFYESNPLHIYLSNFIDEESMDAGFLLNGNFVERNELVNYANQQGYDCIIFDYDDSDTHVLLLNNANISNVIEIKLFVDNPSLQKLLPLKFDSDNCVLVPLHHVAQIDLILYQNT